MASLNSTRRINLPDIEPQNVIGAYATLYTYREDGLRLEYQSINDKNIFHNYGQGASELSLSYGCAYIISKTLTVRVDPTKLTDVAVIGSTINAFMTALELSKRGYLVTLYADKVPGEQNYPYMESSFWYPGHYDNCDPLRHELLSKLSYEFFTESLSMRRYQSFSWQNCYVKGPKSESLKQSVSDFVNKEIFPVLLNFGNEKLEEYVAMKTILIDANLFLKEIYTELKLRSVSIVKKSFASIEDVMEVKEREIFNCLGTECRKIFDDHNVTGIKKHFLEMECSPVPANELFCIWKSSEHEEDADVIINATGGKLFLSSSWELDQDSNKVNPEVKESILTRSYHFVKERKNKPYKL